MAFLLGVVSAGPAAFIVGYALAKKVWRDRG